jgi:hypothetical protein
MATIAKHRLCWDESRTRLVADHDVSAVSLACTPGDELTGDLESAYVASFPEPVSDPVPVVPAGAVSPTGDFAFTVALEGEALVVTIDGKSLALSEFKAGDLKDLAEWIGVEKGGKRDEVYDRVAAELLTFFTGGATLVTASVSYVDDVAVVSYSVTGGPEVDPKTGDDEDPETE